MSGHADYDMFEKDIPENITIYNVPIIQATKESLKGYGEIVTDFENTKVNSRFN